MHDLDALAKEVESCRKECGYGDANRVNVHLQNLYTCALILIDQIKYLSSNPSPDK